MSEWTRTTLGALCAEGGGSIQTGPFGSQLHASDYQPSGVPVVMPQDIGDNRVSTGAIARISEADASRLSRHRLRQGDIVYSRRGDLGRRSIIRRNEVGWLCGTGCLKVSLGASSSHSAEFVSLLLGTNEVRGWIQRHAVGATMPNLNTGILSNAPLLVPAPSVQRAIAEVLGALDDKIQANAEVADRCDRLACAMFEHASLEALLGETTYERFCEISGGGTPSTKETGYWDGQISWATPTDITQLRGPYLERTSRQITEEGLAACSSALHEPLAILMTSRATIGAFALAGVPTAVNQGFIVARARDSRFQMWLFHEMRSRVDEFKSLANGATFLELSRGRFKAMPVMLAEPGVMAGFGDSVESLHERARAALREAEKLAQVRDFLLPRLMSGAIRVKVAEDIVSEGV